MFAAASELLEAADTVRPYPSCKDLQDGWWAEFEEMLEATLPAEEIEESRKTLDLFQSCADDIFSLFLERATTMQWAQRTPDERAAHVEALMARPHIPQRTAEWYAQTRDVLTASEFSTILGTPRAVGVLAAAKGAPLPEAGGAVAPPRLACATLEMGPMDWGVRFEPVVKQILQERWGAEILEVGRLLHPSDAHLAASPDGLILSADDPDRVGRLVEIKCPIRREITGQIPFEYWCQMQIQMEVCDIDECEYVEAKLRSGYRDSAPHRDSSPVPEQETGPVTGLVWLLQEPDTLQLKYAYTPLERSDLEAAGWNVMEEIPWVLEALAVTRVVRDRAWFASTAERREAFWTAVRSARAGTYEVPPSSRPPVAKSAGKPKALIVNVCKIED